jgi:hypothetical protein
MHRWVKMRYLQLDTSQIKNASWPPDQSNHKKAADIEGVDVFYAMIQHSPSCVRVVRLRTQRT